MKNFTQTYKIKAPLSKVWAALTDPKQITSWGGGPAKMDGRVGTKFSLWGGEIYGTNTYVKPMTKLVQDWYGGKWLNQSEVTFALSEKYSTTTLILIHKNIPDTEASGIASGWKDYYLGPLKDLVEKS